MIFLPKQFFFPAGMAYVLYGIGRTVFHGLLERLPAARDNGQSDNDDNDDNASPAPGDEAENQRQRRRRRRQSRNNPGRAGREDPLA